MAKQPLKLSFLFLLLVPIAMAEIRTLTMDADSRPMILVERFRFTRTGYAMISVSSVSVVSAPANPDPTRLGFFLLSDESLTQVLIEFQQMNAFCVLDSRFINRLFNFQELSPPPAAASFNRTFPVTSPNKYSLFFANCAPESKVSMNVHTELYNLDSGNDKDYLGTI